MYHYYCYGLILKTEQKIHGLKRASGVVSADFTVYWRPFSDGDFLALDWAKVDAIGFRKRVRISAFSAASSSGERLVSFKYDMNHFGQVTTVISISRSCIWLDFPNTMTQADRCSLFIGTIIGSILRLRGRLCLHSSVVSFDNKSLLLIGERGAGKSTTAKALCDRHSNAALVADDIAVLDFSPDTISVLSGYPAFRLHIDAFAHLNVGQSANFKKVYSNEEKRYLEADSWGADSTPLGALCFLNGQNGDEQTPSTVSVSGREAMLRLTANTYANYALLNQSMIQFEFQRISELIKSTSIHEVTYHKSHDQMPALCDALVNLID